MKKFAYTLIVLMILTGAAWAQTEATPTPTPTPTPEPEQPRTADDFMREAINAFKIGDLAGAERAARTVTALDSRNVEAHYLLGRVLLYRAAQMNRLLIENRGGDSAVLPADQQWKAGVAELQEAVSQFRIVIKLEPNNTSAWLLLATCLDNLGQKDEAINAYKQTVNLDPIAPTARDAWNNLGLLHMGQKRYKQAKVCFDNALNIDPTFTPARLNLEKLKKLKPSLFR